MTTESTPRSEADELDDRDDYGEIEDQVDTPEETSDASTSSHVLQRAIVLERFQIFFVPVPKAGCTSILWSLAELAGLPESAFADSEGREVTRALAIHDLRRWPELFRFGARSDEDRAKILGSDDWFRFTVVRQPFRRLWSAWQSKVLLAEPQFVDRYSEQPWFPRQLRSADDVVGAWRDFLTALRDDPDLLRADVHWSPQVDVLDFSDVSYDHIGQVEKLGETLDRVRDHLKETVGVELPEPPRTNLSALPYTDALYTEADLDLVSNLYAEDLRTFGYELPTGGDVGKDLPADWISGVDAAVPAIEELRNRHERVADLQQILKGRRKEIKDLDRRLTRQRRLRREERARNERLVERIQDAHKELEKIHQSRAWQYTAPLRNAGKRYRRIKRKLRGRR